MGVDVVIAARNVERVRGEADASPNPSVSGPPASRSFPRSAAAPLVSSRQRSAAATFSMFIGTAALTEAPLAQAMAPEEKG